MRRFHWIEWDMAAPGEATKDENGGIGQIPQPPLFLRGYFSGRERCGNFPETVDDSPPTSTFGSLLALRATTF